MWAWKIAQKRWQTLNLGLTQKRPALSIYPNFDGLKDLSDPLGDVSDPLGLLGT